LADRIGFLLPIPNCTTPLIGSVKLTEDIYVWDTDIGPDLLNTSSCDADGFRWTYYGSSLLSSSSSSGSALLSPSSSSDSTLSASSSSSSKSSTNSISADLNAASRNGEASLSSAQSTSGSNVGEIGAIIGGIAVVLGILGFVFHRRRRRRKRGSATTSDVRTSSLTADGSAVQGLRGQSGLWTDDVITAKRISRRDVHINRLLSRGAFGEVYEGVFDDRRVAVKMLPPETRGLIHHVNTFLAEAKLTAVMDHPRIISFVGVAWNSLSDVCVVLEFMEGGDLRTLLNEYNSSHHPVGIDREKATIALHVCHALTYLHSLSPAVIHRDLKSRNILLSSDMEAKLTDFGISRERPDQTMTAGVGTSLWMAPEVMLGQRYDDKADMFSFGVVLSELAVHTLPYAQSNETRDSNGKRLPDAILLQRVAMGKLSVAFSEANPASITELGRACVSVDPSLRPTAAEALYKLQVALAEDFE